MEKLESSATQWRAVADARELQERRAAALADAELIAYTWRDRRRRVNDDQWLNADAPPPARQETEESESRDWTWWAVFAIVVACGFVLLNAFYLLSCGLNPVGCSR